MLLQSQEDQLIRSAARRLKGHQRRLFIAEVTIELCDGNARFSETRFGWGRETANKGMQELRKDVPLERAAGGGRPRWEEQNPALAADIRAIVEPKTQTDPELKSTRRYTNLSAAEVRKALIEQQGYCDENIPAERTLRDILNRMNYRLKRIQKGRPLKKTKETNAIFENVCAVKAASRADPETLEISADTKAKVAIGDYSRGGKKQDRFGRQSGRGMGS
jgi:hypothetical protein